MLTAPQPQQADLTPDPATSHQHQQSQRGLARFAEDSNATSGIHMSERCYVRARARHARMPLMLSAAARVEPGQLGLDMLATQDMPDVTLLSYTVRSAGAVESAAEEASASEQAAAPSSPAPPPEPQYDIVKRLRLQIGSANIPHPDKVGVLAES